MAGPTVVRPGSDIEDHGLRSGYACHEAARAAGRVTARRILLGGLVREAGIFDLVSDMAPLHPRNNTFPGEVFLGLGADALDWCGASPADRWSWREFGSGSFRSARSAAAGLRQVYGSG